MNILSKLWCHMVAVTRGVYIFSIIFVLAIAAGFMVGVQWGKDEWESSLKSSCNKTE